MSFFCEKCNYYTTRRDNYNRHLESQKHQIPQKKTTQKQHKPQKITAQKQHNEDFVCKYCNCVFKHPQSLYRHIKYYCRKNKDEDLKELVRLMNLQLEQQNTQMIQRDKELEYQKQQIQNQRKQIDKLAEKLQVTNNITNNNNIVQNNIQLLSYKDTDISHLTEIDYVSCIEKINHCVKHLI